MIPGVGLLYSGLLRRKNALSMLLISILAIAVGSFQWFFCSYPCLPLLSSQRDPRPNLLIRLRSFHTTGGYSLAFSEQAASNHYIGGLKYFAFMNVLDQQSGKIPVLLFAICESSSSSLSLSVMET